VQVPFSLCFTKLDLVQPDQVDAEAGEAVVTVQAAQNVHAFHMALSAYCAPAPVHFVATSAVSGLGMLSLRKYISQIRQGFELPYNFV
jgi:hypothetical protein